MGETEKLYDVVMILIQAVIYHELSTSAVEYGYILFKLHNACSLLVLQVNVIILISGCVFTLIFCVCLLRRCDYGCIRCVVIRGRLCSGH